MPGLPHVLVTEWPAARRAGRPRRRIRAGRTRPYILLRRQERAWRRIIVRPRRGWAHRHWLAVRVGSFALTALVVAGWWLGVRS